MKMYTPMENQGQIVEISYGWDDGIVYMRMHDLSNGITRWYRADPDWDRESAETIIYEREPYIIGEWERC